MKETVVRAVRTFLQAAVGYIAANLAMGLSGADNGAASLKTVLTGLIAAAVACGLAAVMNLPRKGEKAPESPIEADETGKNDSESGASGGAVIKDSSAYNLKLGENADEGKAEPESVPGGADNSTENITEESEG